MGSFDLSTLSSEVKSMSNFKAKWKKYKDNSISIIWKSQENTHISIEANNLGYGSGDPEDAVWYVFGAVDGRGVSHTPEIVQGKRDAIRAIAKLKRKYDKSGVYGFK